MLQFDEEQIRKAMVKEIIAIFNRKISIVMRHILDELINSLTTIIEMSDTWKELNDTSSNLRGELGIPLDVDLSQLISAYTSNLKIRGDRFKTVAGNAVLKTEFFLPANYSSLLNKPEASFISDSKRFKKSFKIDWLDWLLTHGDEAVVVDHYFQPSGRGRTHLGTMKYVESTFWSVPKQHSGTEDDNFITRAIEKYSANGILEKQIEIWLKGAF